MKLLNKKFPIFNIKIKKILLCSLLITSIQFISANALTKTTPPITQSQVPTTYLVKSGDSLYSISKKFGITVPILRETNSIINNIIYVGQQIKIVNPPPNIYIPKITSNSEDVLILVNKNHSLDYKYIPNNLVIPNVPFPFKENDGKKLMRQDAAIALEEMFKSAKKSSINIFALSGYRSYNLQKALYTSSSTKYGANVANQSIAKPSQSEHQTGLAMDITCASVKYGLSEKFGETPEGIWLKTNSWQFGFILRYQKGKESITGYRYEPWHFRYVGKKASEEITNRNITLEEYIGAK